MCYLCIKAYIHIYYYILKPCIYIYINQIYHISLDTSHMVIFLWTLAARGHVTDDGAQLPDGFGGLASFRWKPSVVYRLRPESTQ